MASLEVPLGTSADVPEASTERAPLAPSLGARKWLGERTAQVYSMSFNSDPSRERIVFAGRLLVDGASVIARCQPELELRETQSKHALSTPRHRG